MRRRRFLRHAGSAATSTETRRRRARRSSKRSRAHASSRCARYRARCAGSRRRSRRAARSCRSRTELDESIARDERELPEYAATIGDAERARAVPAQALVRLVAARQRRLRESGRAARGPRRDRAKPRAPQGGARIADGRLADARRRVELFGFHLAKLDVRLHARRVARADARTRDAFAAAAAARRHGPRALDTVIVSGDVVAPPTCSVRSTLDATRPCRIVPLFETIADLAAAPRRRRASCSPTSASRAVAERGARLEVMVGYSDSGKDGGYLAAQLGDLPRAGGARGGRARGRRRADDLPRPRRQRRPRRRPDARGDPRAGAGRAAGPAEADRAGRDDLVQVRPAGDRATATSRRRSPGRVLERVPGDRRPHARRRRARAAGRALAAARRRAYRALVWHDAEFVRLLPRLHAGRRARAARDRLAPGAAARRARDYLGSLRAIPWVFAWTQNRDAAAGLVRLRHRVRGRRPRARCGDLYRELPFFRSLVDNLEMTLAKSSLEMARRVPRARARRSSSPSALFGMIADEHARTVSRRARDRRARTRCSSATPSLRRSIATAQPVRRPDERDPGRAAAPLPRRRRATRGCR